MYDKEALLKLLGGSQIFQQKNMCNNEAYLVKIESIRSKTVCEEVRDNISSYLTYVPELTPTEAEKISYIAIFSVIIVLSYHLNAALIWYLVSAKFGIKSKVYKRPRSDNFIISLAISDLLITLLVIPFNIYRLQTSNNWKLSSSDDYVNMWTCKLSAYIQSVASLSSMFTLTALSIDR